MRRFGNSLAKLSRSQIQSFVKGYPARRILPLARLSRNRRKTVLCAMTRIDDERPWRNAISLLLRLRRCPTLC